MANEQHVQLLKQGAEVWNAWRKENRQIQPDLESADLSGMNLDHFLLWNTRLQGARLTGTSLRHTSLFQSHLAHVSLIKADLHKANFSGADLSYAQGAGVDFRNARLLGTNFTGAELSQAAFQGMDLSGITFVRAHLQSAQFDEASFSLADLRGADFSEARFWRSRLEGTQLAGANLSYAYLQETFLKEVFVQDTDFHHAVLWSTFFCNVDLSEARGLETVRHVARSFVDFHTWFRSQGRISPIFLRGIGVAEPFFQGMNARKAKPVYEITGFIVYHPADEAFAHRLYETFQHQGIRCWLASEYFVGGGSQHVITKAFQPLDKTFLILSEHTWSMTKFFIQDAREREQKSSKHLLFPLYIDQSAWEQDNIHNPNKAFQKHWVGNFVGWQQEDVYQQASQRLLDILRQEPPLDQ